MPTASVKEGSNTQDRLAQDKDACGVGFYANFKNPATHEALQKGLAALASQQHRGGVDADGLTGDGAGIETQLPEALFRELYGAADDRQLGVGQFFLPKDHDLRARTIQIVEQKLKERGFQDFKWRDVPTNDDVLGEKAAAVKPHMAQLIIPVQDGMDTQKFEHALYIARREIENQITAEGLTGEGKDAFYIPSMSGKTIVYKGMTLATNLGEFYTDLQNPAYKTQYVKFHQRFSTNTFPVFPRAHPFRKLAHNGEINTLKSNKNNMPAVESFLEESYGADADIVMPIIQAGGSDSADFDNVIEATAFAGYPQAAIKSLYMPEAYEGFDDIPEDLRKLYTYGSTVSAPWDGPATTALSNGDSLLLGGDRSGFRPVRYAITQYGEIIAGSESGMVKFDQKDIIKKGNLAAGEMLAVDLLEGRVVYDQELKEQAVAAFKDKIALVDRLQIIERNVAPADHYKYAEDISGLRQRQRLFDFTEEMIEKSIAPMAQEGKEPLGSMGHDAQEPYIAGAQFQIPFSHFFKQLFAQVTNPPIDSKLERAKMSLSVILGRFEDRNRPLQLSTPILSSSAFESVIKKLGRRSVVIDTVFSKGETIEQRLDYIVEKALTAARAGKHIILSDLKAGEDQLPLPSLLVTSVINARLNQEKIRHKTSINVQTAQARDPHDFATLIGMGANTVTPYLTEETIKAECASGRFGEFPAISNLEQRLDGSDVPVDDRESVVFSSALKNYYKASEDALLKIMSKMGVSTVNSYRGSMLFGAKGLSKEFLNKYFPGVNSRIDGIGLDEIEKRIRHFHGKNMATLASWPLQIGGLNQKRIGDRPHATDAFANRLLQDSAINSDPEQSYEKHKAYTNYLDRQAENNPVRLRHFWDFDRSKVTPISLAEVEPEEEIMKKIMSSAAISYGSISPEAHETLAVAMNRIGGRSNSGEGGEEPARLGTEKRSKIKQVASGRFGVTPGYLLDADEIQIKIAQGAKPGLGGELPGTKVDATIAKMRHCKPGTTLISPPPHHDIYSIEDLAQLIADIKEASPKARVNVKLVAAEGVETVAVGVAKCGADAITISGGTGGTGASPQTAINHSGDEFEEHVGRVHSALIENGLREKVELITDGGINRGRDMVVGGMLGADSFVMGLALIEAMGCQQARVCQNNTCPVGIATQNPELRKNFAPDAVDRVINFLRNNATEIREIMASLGIKKFEDLVGRKDLLKQVSGFDLIRNFDEIVHNKNIESERGFHYGRGERKEYKNPVRPDHISVDRDLISAQGEEILSADPAVISLQVGNEDRNLGTRISSEIVMAFNGSANVPNNVFTYNLTGEAGQSLGAFAAGGVKINLTGDSNDYVGKGLAGAQINVRPDPLAPIAEAAHDNIIIGNTCLYGATSGSLFADGMAGNRFAVRNSGAVAVVNGAQDDACEYMTGGEVVIMGKVGKNFAAGMSGGSVFVYDVDGTAEKYAGLDGAGKKHRFYSVAADENAKSRLKERMEQHVAKTGSRYAQDMLDNFDQAVHHFKLIAPSVKPAEQWYPEPFDIAA